MDSFAIILDWWPTEPVYHGFDNDRLNERSDDNVSRDYTRCGRLVTSYDPDTGRMRTPGDWFPIKHADKFARPCRRCFADSDAA